MMTWISTSSILSRACGTAIAVTLLSLPILGISQESPAPQSQAPASDELEEIIVYGGAPLTQLRVQVYKAEDNYFATFNELNSTDEFDIHCRREAPTGTRIAQRVCRAKFVTDLQARATREGVPFGEFAHLLREKEELLNAEMRALVFEHPELLDALSEFDAAHEAFESERERRCAGQLFFCRR